MADNVIELVHLQKQFGDHAVLRDINLSVKKGEVLMILEAMKMENEIRSVTDGVVKEVFVEAGMKVGLNDRIMVIE